MTPVIRMRTLGAFSYAPGSVLGPRVRNQFELVWPLTEWFDVEVDACRVHIELGDCLLLKPLEKNTFFFSPSGVTRHGYLTFQILDEKLASHVSNLPARHTPGAFQTLFDNAVLALHSAEESQPADLERLARLVAAYLDLCDWPPIATRSAPQRRRSRLEAVLGMIDAGLPSDSSISVGELARRAGITERQLSRLFHKAFDCAPSTYLRRRRLAHGAQLLRRTEMGMAEIAGQCGFETPYAFSRAFHDVYGLPPGKYRKQARLS